MSAFKRFYHRSEDPLTAAIPKGMSVTALIIWNVKENLSSSEDSFVIRFAVNYLQNNLGQNN